MASKEPNYDAMADETETALALTDDAEDETESDLDAEFLMHAKDAGLTEAQAGSLKLAMERCIELKGEGAYTAEDDEDMDLDEEAAE
jgi:hypothetical protein